MYFRAPRRLHFVKREVENYAVTALHRDWRPSGPLGAAHRRQCDDVARARLRRHGAEQDVVGVGIRSEKWRRREVPIASCSTGCRRAIGIVERATAIDAVVHVLLTRRRRGDRDRHSAQQRQPGIAYAAAEERRGAPPRVLRFRTDRSRSLRSVTPCTCRSPFTTTLPRSGLPRSPMLGSTVAS
jgi:hypothetical protein